MPTDILITSLPGIIFSIVLFVLFYRNRKQNRLTRRRFLLPFILVLAHTLLFSLGTSLVLLYKEVALSNFLAFLWFILSLIMLVTVMIYWGHLPKWKNSGLLATTFTFTLYCTLVLLALFLGFGGMGC